MLEYGRFLREFFSYPVATGAVAPSSQRLAARMTENMGLSAAAAVVELGPGTGSFTRAILEQIAPEALFLAVELNPRFAAELQLKFPRARIINDSGERLTLHLAAHGRISADCILSSLPWAGFSEDLQDRLMKAVVDALRPGGRFSTFAYVHAAWLPPARRFRRVLGRHFSKIETTPAVWRNLPPAFVYRCLK